MWIIGWKNRLQNQKMCQVPRREQSSQTKWIFKWTVSPFRRTPLFGPADYFFRFGCFFLWPVMSSSRYSERGTRYLEQGAAPSLPNFSPDLRHIFGGCVGYIELACPRATWRFVLKMAPQKADILKRKCRGPGLCGTRRNASVIEGHCDIWLWSQVTHSILWMSIGHRMNIWHPTSLSVSQ